MAGFKQRSLSLQQIQSIPNNIDSNSLDIFYLSDGSIRAKAYDGSEFRLDNVDSTLVDVSGQLYSLIQTVSGDLVVYVNSISGSLVSYVDSSIQTLSGDLVTYVDGVASDLTNTFNSSLQSVSGDLYTQMNILDSNAVHKTGNEYINGIKTFANVAYFMDGLVVNGEVIDIETTHLKVKDNIISLNVGVTGTPILNSGFEVIRGSFPAADIIWNESLGYWTAGISGGLEKIILQSDLNSAILNLSGGSFASLQSSVASLSAQVMSISANVNILNSQVVDLSAQVLLTSSQVSSISGQVASISANVNTLNSQVVDISSNLVQLNSTFNINTLGITGGINQLDSRFVNISGDTVFGPLIVNNNLTVSNDVTINSLSSNNGKIVSLDNAGKLQASSVATSSIATLTDLYNLDLDLQSQIFSISFNLPINYYNKSQINSITGQIYTNYTLADAAILAQVANISSQELAYIDSNFVTLNTTQDISGYKNFLNSSLKKVLSTQTSSLYDNSEIGSVGWNSRILYDSLGLDSVNWNSRTLRDSSLGTTINWDTKNLYSTWTIDALNVLSLPASASNNFVTWSAAGLIKDSGINFSTITSQVANVSANLQAQINAIPVESTTIASSSGNILVSNVGSSYNINVNDFISKTQVASVSAGLDSRTSSNSNSINTLFSTYANTSTVAAISAGLDVRINANGAVDTQQTNSINTLFSTYANSTTVAAISAGLNTRTNSNTNSINTLFSTYTNSSTTQAISAGLDARITANSLVDSQQTNSINTLFSTYANSTTVAAISAGLDTRITANNLVDSQQTNSINTLFSTYANTSTVAAISAGLNTRVSATELLNSQQTNSINTLYSTYANSTTVAAISAGLDSRITANNLVDSQQANSINTLFSTYANSTTVAAISAGLKNTDNYLQSQIDAINSISGSYALDANVVHKTGNETISGIKTFSSTISGNIDNTNLDIGVNFANTIQIGGNNTSLINIGQGASPATINIGSASDTVNILGSLVYVKTINTQVIDNTITINVSGAAGSSDLSGIYVEENGISGAGFARIDNSRNSWAFKAPNRAGKVSLTPSSASVNDQISSSSTTNQFFTLPDKSGTFALVGDIPSQSSVVHTTGNEFVYGIKNFYFPSNALSLSTSGSAFYDTTTNKSIDWNIGTLYANTLNSKSVDYANRYLYASNGFASVDWQLKKLIDGNGYTSYDWGQRLAWYNNNSTIAINFSASEVAINDISGGKAISSNRVLLDSAANTTLDWQNRTLQNVWTANNGIIVGTIVPVKYDSSKSTSVVGTNFVIDTIATSSCEAASWKIVITDGTINKRITNVDAIFSSSLIEYHEFGSRSLGDTSMVTLSCDISGSMARLLASASSGTWTIKLSKINF